MIRLFFKRIPGTITNYGIFRFSKLNNEMFPVAKSYFPKTFFHSSCYQLNEMQPEDVSVEDIKKHVRLSPAQARKIAYDTVDWLPFTWKRRPRHNPFEDSGDLVKHIEYDPTWPKPNFEFSDELKTASDDVKYRYSLATASQVEVKEVVKRKWLEKIQRHPNDFDSLEVKIALKTLQVRGLFEHMWKYKKERRNGRKVLDIMIKKRNRCLKQLYRVDLDRLNWICKELKLDYTPKELGGHKERYCKKWDLRRLTKEYCAKMVKDKKNAYHEELKKQQIDFMKEKEEALAWMEKEKEEITKVTEEIAITTKKLERLAV